MVANINNYYEFEFDSFYCYPNTNVLKNKLNVQDEVKLNVAEREITSVKISVLEKNIIRGNFDLKHLKDIHKNIFCDIYDWAGQIRTVNIIKGNMFCNCMYINVCADELFKKLKSENYLRKLPFNELPDKLAFYFGEINALHPFREGNGRTQRLFIEYLARELGYSINFTKITEKEMIDASNLAFIGKYDSMTKIFNNVLEKN
ncbi:MAG: Fic family protein [Candidatus Paraimprobicoccus trichonymphae]|uniref:protein adenylyltransferase n=1 Tax=Candidatus Paraimprobicoccus trichonymphae TaxID=3033793 RepID=A0AA48KZK1_9FIRM|nr:MAG: Fic family protein [Candidatus Paraimprobicoccus trichonymphae]